MNKTKDVVQQECLLASSSEDDEVTLQYCTIILTIYPRWNIIDYWENIIVHRCIQLTVVTLRPALVFSRFWGFPGDPSCWWRRSERPRGPGRTRTCSEWEWSGRCPCLDRVKTDGISSPPQAESTSSPRQGALWLHWCKCRGSRSERGPTLPGGRHQPTR